MIYQIPEYQICTYFFKKELKRWMLFWKIQEQNSTLHIKHVCLLKNMCQQTWFSIDRCPHWLLNLYLNAKWISIGLVFINHVHITYFRAEMLNTVEYIIACKPQMSWWVRQDIAYSFCGWEFHTVAQTNRIYIPFGSFCYLDSWIFRLGYIILI